MRTDKVQQEIGTKKLQTVQMHLHLQAKSSLNSRLGTAHHRQGLQILSLSLPWAQATQQLLKSRASSQASGWGFLPPSTVRFVVLLFFWSKTKKVQIPLHSGKPVPYAVFPWGFLGLATCHPTHGLPYKLLTHPGSSTQPCT